MSPGPTRPGPTTDHDAGGGDSDVRNVSRPDIPSVLRLSPHPNGLVFSLEEEGRGLGVMGRIECVRHRGIDVLVAKFVIVPSEALQCLEETPV